MKLSIIIPTLNEAEALGRLLSFFTEEMKSVSSELIVVDGGSTDGTQAIAEKFDLQLVDCPSGRGKQMNVGAETAQGEILYFVHADTLPPKGCLQEIVDAVEDGGQVGSYQTRFEKSNWAMRVNAFFTRYNFIWCRGGDQSLFIRKNFFQELNGFRDDYSIMEDYELIQRAERKKKFTILPRHIEISVRKYEHNSYMRVNLSNLLIFIMYFLGFSPSTMKKTYQRLLN